jgi:hypothetical protein
MPSNNICTKTKDTGQLDTFSDLFILDMKKSILQKYNE